MNTEKLSDSLLEEIENHAVHIAREAGQILFEQFRKPLEVQFKDKQNLDPVTSADHLSDEYLKKAISEKFPTHLILSEEGGELPESGETFVWVIDPLDGTINYMNGLPLFAVSIGVLWKRQPVVGSIYVPVSHRGVSGAYHARLGHGAFFNDEIIKVGNQPTSRPLAEIPVHFRSRFRLSGQSAKKPAESRNLGSIALEICLAACGVFQYAFFGHPKLWDVAGGVLLVKEAGGQSFIKRPERKDWQALDRFYLERDSDSEKLEDLRKWAFPIMVGAAESSANLVKDIRIRRNLLAGLAVRFGHNKK